MPQIKIKIGELWEAELSIASHVNGELDHSIVRNIFRL